jgi:hypothetical protein
MSLRAFVFLSAPSCTYFTKTQTHRHRARNLRFLMPHFGQKTWFRDRMKEIKSGIPCSASSCHCVRLYFCKPILQIFYTDTNASSRQKPNASSCHRVRLCFCKPILQIFDKDTNASSRQKPNASSCHRVRLCFCKPILQIFDKDTNASSRQNQRIVIACVCIFVRSILQIFDKDTNA